MRSRTARSAAWARRRRSASTSTSIAGLQRAAGGHWWRAAAFRADLYHRLHLLHIIAAAAQGAGPGHLFAGEAHAGAHRPAAPPKGHLHLERRQGAGSWPSAGRAMRASSPTRSSARSFLRRVPSWTSRASGRRPLRRPWAGATPSGACRTRGSRSTPWSATSIDEVLRETGNNISATARRLGSPASSCATA